MALTKNINYSSTDTYLDDSEDDGLFLETNHSLRGDPYVRLKNYSCYYFLSVNDGWNKHSLPEEGHLFFNDSSKKNDYNFSFDDTTYFIMPSFENFQNNPKNLMGYNFLIESENLLKVEIEKSRYILDYNDDWDDNGSKGYKKETWLKATNFLLNFYDFIKEKFGVHIPVPKIYHGPDGSIDVLWKSKNYRLLINVPDNLDLITYYGDDYDGKKIFIQDSMDLNEIGLENKQLTSILLFLLRFQ